MPAERPEVRLLQQEHRGGGFTRQYADADYTAESAIISLLLGSSELQGPPPSSHHRYSWAQQDSDLRPSLYESAALTAELWAPYASSVRPPANN